MSWDPDTYLAFAGPRERPALDLVERIPLPADEVVEVVDLGAGPGNLVPLLRDRFPLAHITAVDNDPRMLARAHEEVAGSRVTVLEGDATSWQPPRAVDVLFSNAALHWVDDHAMVLPRLLSSVRPGGVLAVQMPRNHDAPSHRLLTEVAAEGPWAEVVAGRLRPSAVASPEDYHRMLVDHAATLDVWETTYVHHLSARPDGVHPVAAWLRGSTMRPLLAALGDESDLAEDLLAAYGEAVTEAYPLDATGNATFCFTRLFIVASTGPVTVT